jgi:polysaccharide lyase family 4-like protein
VVPVGSTVAFPNADPFFHNVFSLFNGKRFDLGLYEAGTTKEVNFSRDGVSYIFCNIHPDMSAVVLALSTPLYSVADSGGAFSIQHVPTGEYELHVWVEGFTQTALDHLTRRVQISSESGDLGIFDIAGVPHQPAQHLNKFGQPYDEDSKPTY